MTNLILQHFTAWILSLVNHLQHCSTACHLTWELHAVITILVSITPGSLTHQILPNLQSLPHTACSIQTDRSADQNDSGINTLT